MKYFFNRINVFSKSSFSVQKYSRAGIHAEKRAKFPFNFGTFVHVAKAISRHGKTHMACCKKYKPYILKYKALILKQVPCIFCLSITLFFRYLQNGDFRPFRDSFFAPDFDIIQEQTSILSVPERPSTVYSVFPALRPFRNGNKNQRKCTFYICEPMLCTINAADFTRKRIFPEIMCISCVN